MNIQEIRKNNYILTPSRYIDFQHEYEDDETYDEKMKSLTATLKEQIESAKEIDNRIKENLAKIDYEI